jgi:hypothetical protein
MGKYIFHPILFSEILSYHVTQAYSALSTFGSAPVSTNRGCLTQCSPNNKNGGMKKIQFFKQSRALFIPDGAMGGAEIGMIERSNVQTEF